MADFLLHFVYKRIAFLCEFPFKRRWEKIMEKYCIFAFVSEWIVNKINVFKTSELSSKLQGRMLICHCNRCELLTY